MHRPIATAARRVAGLAPALLLAACGLAGAENVAAGQPTPETRGDAMSDFEKPAKEDLRERLTPLQYRVTQEEGTEPAFRNEYWDNHEAGIYVDVVSGEPLFSSLDKYDSGSGWPSFTQPLEPENLTARSDTKLWMERTEIRSKTAGSHLGHVFDDGPGPTGKRFCMNSAAMRFIPVDRLEDEGYGRYLSLFASTGGGGGGATEASKDADAATAPAGPETALLAGGCFWGVEELLRELPGVISTEVGYTGGITSDPVYEDVHAGSTGHAEAVKVVFDPAQTSYEDLLLFFFKMHDPTTLNRQGNDVGTSYRSAIFWTTEAQRETAEKIKARVDASGAWKRPVVTEITKASEFYSAEEYHQDYLQKHPNGYTCHFVRDLVF